MKPKFIKYLSQNSNRSNYINWFKKNTHLNARRAIVCTEILSLVESIEIIHWATFTHHLHVHQFELLYSSLSHDYIQIIRIFNKVHTFCIFRMMRYTDRLAKSYVKTVNTISPPPPSLSNSFQMKSAINFAWNKEKVKNSPQVEQIFKLKFMANIVCWQSCWLRLMISRRSFCVFRANRTEKEASSGVRGQ